MEIAFLALTIISISGVISASFAFLGVQAAQSKRSTPRH